MSVQPWSVDERFVTHCPVLCKLTRISRHSKYPWSDGTAASTITSRRKGDDYHCTGIVRDSFYRLRRFNFICRLLPPSVFPKPTSSEVLENVHNRQDNSFRAKGRDYVYFVTVFRCLVDVYVPWLSLSHGSLCGAAVPGGRRVGIALTETVRANLLEQRIVTGTYASVSMYLIQFIKLLLWERFVIFPQRWYRIVLVRVLTSLW